MTDEAVIELRQLQKTVEALVNSITPYIGQDEMKSRYDVCGKTLLAMERKKQIPERVNGRWFRTEVLEWERLARFGR